MIRAARVDDLPGLVELGEALHAQSAYASLSYVPSRVESTLRDLVTGDGFVWVAEKDDHLIGGFAGGLTAHWFGYDLHGFDYSFFVLPEHRHGVVAINLLMLFEDWCLNHGAKEIRLGITTGVAVEGTTRLYQYLGYEQNGSLFRKELSHGH